MKTTFSSSLEEPPPIAAEPLAEWKKILKRSPQIFKQAAVKFQLSAEELNVCSKYPVRINPYYLSLIEEKNDPIYKQCFPSAEEVNDKFGEEDPLHEEPENQARKNVPSLLTHRYPDRVLFRVSNQCAMFCRFCTRKRMVGDIVRQPTWRQVEAALSYIKQHEELTDVILSGGDPLMLDDIYLEKIISEVFKIIRSRNGVIRIGTRMPCVLPQRVTKNLCEMLKKYHPIYINTHFNHPKEITPESRRACAMLADAGIPLGNQSVLLKGVNDSPEVMRNLMKGLISMRVKPYYIYQADPVKGTNHFRTRVEKGMEIYRALRGHISGMAVPMFVIDAPGGGGKIPAIPSYIEDASAKKIKLKNYQGTTHEYPQVGPVL